MSPSDENKPQHQQPNQPRPDSGGGHKGSPSPHSPQGSPGQKSPAGQPGQPGQPGAPREGDRESGDRHQGGQQASGGVAIGARPMSDWGSYPRLSVSRYEVPRPVSLGASASSVQASGNVARQDQMR